MCQPSLDKYKSEKNFVRETQTHAHYNIHPYSYMIVPTVIVQYNST